VTVRLRPHHLLCILTYVGKGYGPAFIANYDAVAKRISGGEDILLVAGPDDICAPLLHGAAPHCHRESVRARDAKAAKAVARMLGRPVRTGDPLSLGAPTLARLRAAFAGGRFREACADCSWSPLCTTIARGDYAGVRVQPEPLRHEPSD
jgi:hypothetical protein